MIWTSADGAQWRGTALPRGLKDARYLVPFQGGLAAFVDTSDYRGGRYGFRFDAWRSAEGVAWRRSGSIGYAVPRGLDLRECQASQPWPTSIDGRLMVYVAVCWDPCCGIGPVPFGGGVAAFAARTTPERGVIAWQSRDGRHWQRAQLTGLAPDGPGDYGVTFVRAAGGVFALREGSEPALFRSDDGSAWTPFGNLPPGLSTHGRVAVVSADDGVLLIGDVLEGTSSYGNEMHVWRMEMDGTTTESYLRSSAVAESILVEGRGVLVIGEGGGPGPQGLDGPQHRWAWIIGSRDGGRTWDDDLAWTGSNDSCLQEAVRDGRTVVALACVSEVQGAAPEPWTLPAIWVAESLRLPR